MTYITWFDPGVSTGIARGWFNEDSHYEPRAVWQVPGGQEGLMDWLRANQIWLHHEEIVGSEKFIPRPIEGGSHTLESTYPLVQEGLLVGRGFLRPYPRGHWQPASSQVLRKGKSPEESEKLSNDLLKSLGLWLTGEDVGRPDANDVISATKHIIWFLTRTLKHKPTLEWVYGEEHRWARSS